MQQTEIHLLRWAQGNSSWATVLSFVLWDMFTYISSPGSSPKVLKSWWVNNNFVWLSSGSPILLHSICWKMPLAWRLHQRHSDLWNPKSSHIQFPCQPIFPYHLNLPLSLSSFHMHLLSIRLLKRFIYSLIPVFFIAWRFFLFLPFFFFLSFFLFLQEHKLKARVCMPNVAEVSWSRSWSKV